MTVEMKNDPNWLIIRVPRMYADQVADISCGRIVGEAIRLLGTYSNFEMDQGSLDAIQNNESELTAIKHAVDAFSSAVREGFQLEQSAKQS